MLWGARTCVSVFHQSSPPLAPGEALYSMTSTVSPA